MRILLLRKAVKGVYNRSCIMDMTPTESHLEQIERDCCDYPYFCLLTEEQFDKMKHLYKREENSEFYRVDTSKYYNIYYSIEEDKNPISLDHRKTETTKVTDWLGNVL